jgi:hypothetical protein
MQTTSESAGSNWLRARLVLYFLLQQLFFVAACFCYPTLAGVSIWALCAPIVATWLMNLMVPLCFVRPLRPGVYFNKTITAGWLSVGIVALWIWAYWKLAEHYGVPISGGLLH